MVHKTPPIRVYTISIMVHKTPPIRVYTNTIYHGTQDIQTLSIMVHTNTPQHSAHIHPLSWCI